MLRKITSAGFALAAGLCLPNAGRAQSFVLTVRDGQCVASSIVGDHVVTAEDIRSLKAGNAPYLSRPLTAEEQQYIRNLPNDPVAACQPMIRGLKQFGLGN